MSQDPLIGQILGGARLLQRVSKGLLAGVYRGHYERLGIPVAVKVLTPKAMAQGMNKERFVREGRALAQLSHPNIIKIYNVGHEGGRYFFIIMDWIQDGMNLRQLAQTRPLTPAQSLKVVERLCDALEYIHSKGLIHRDVKPANVCLRRGGHPVLMDFSLIKDQHSDVKLTAPGTIMGTVNFMPPEQAQPGGPFGDVGPRSDVYSLGGTLYWLLTGKPPFKGRTPMETIIKLMREAPEPPSKHNTSLASCIDDLVLTTLSKRQEERPASARALADQIQSLFQHHAEELKAGRPPSLAEGGRPPATATPAPASAARASEAQWGSGSSQDQRLREEALASSGGDGAAPPPSPAPGPQPANPAPA
ncbi:MAG: serine/threonine protein kinase, partial [Planctomycetota bacterium]